MKVSVSIVTYNHERFIARAIDSVLAQEVNFDYEILIGEDHSSDRTREIVCDYAARYPGRIRLFLHDYPADYVRVNGRRNFVNNLLNVRGEYVALLEGDDWWTSPDKLQKQADFLDRHPECSVCFHNVDVVHEGHPELDHPFHRKALKPFFDLRDVVSAQFIPTCSTMFRARLFPAFPAWYHDIPMGDWPLHILNAEHGRVGYLDEVLGAYLVHGGGIWSGKSRIELLEKTIVAARTIDRHLGFRYGRELNRCIALWEHEIACRMVDEREFRGALRRSWKAIKSSPLCIRVYRKTLFKVLLKTAVAGLVAAAGRGKGRNQL